MSDSFVMCARAVADRRFVAQPGPTLYLTVPEGETPSPKHAVKHPDAWVKKVRKAATWGTDSRTSRERGDILVFIHGYNNSQETVMQRHRQLVDDGIRILAEEQTADCTINTHLLGHSTGAYVIREAFDDADDVALPQMSWIVSQIAFVGGDISAASLSDGNSSSEALYRHCTRLTNYSNRFDSVLKLSNTKRLGMAPRVGRVGLPADASARAVEVDCTEYFRSSQDDSQARAADQKAEIGTFEHSWHIGNRVFARDLFETLRGDLDRAVVPTRDAIESGRFALRRP